MTSFTAAVRTLLKINSGKWPRVFFRQRQTREKRKRVLLKSGLQKGQVLSFINVVSSGFSLVSAVAGN